jgi:glycosyltransferase involved in cell wall biosynthesis
MMNNPKVSVVIPIHGNPAFLEDALRSIYSQTYKNIEIIAVLDRADPWVREFLLSESQIHPILVIGSSAPGISAALNLGITNSSSQYIARFDSDDLMYANRIESQVDFLESNPNVVCLGTQIDFIDSDSKFIRRSNYPLASPDIEKWLSLRNCIAHPSVMFRKVIIQNAGGYRSFFNSTEDYDLWLRLVEFGSICNLPGVLNGYRVSTLQSTKQNVDRRIILESIVRGVQVQPYILEKDTLEELNTYSTENLLRLRKRILIKVLKSSPRQAARLLSADELSASLDAARSAKIFRRYGGGSLHFIFSFILDPVAILFLLKNHFIEARRIS